MSKVFPQNILSNLKNKKPLNKNEIFVTPIIGDSNYFFRSISLFYIDSQDNYDNIRKLIYNYSKENKEILRPFFIEGNNDEIL